MLASYVLSAVRAIQRDPWHAAINVVGLAIALAPSLLIALYVRHELSFEDFISEPARVHRVEAEFRSPNAGAHPMASSPFALTSRLNSDFDGQLIATRLIEDIHNVEAGDVRRRLSVHIVDERFFDVLDFAVARGDAAAAAREPGAAVLTESMAAQLFGRDDPMGRTLRLDDLHELRVAAILEDPPKNSRFQLGVLASLATPALAPVSDIDADWSNWNQETYVRLRGETRASAIAAQLPALVARHRPETDDGSEAILSLRPLRAIHLAEAPDGSLSDRNAVAVAALAATAAFLIFIACFSYINLATARSLLRAKEVGLRKIFGGGAGRLALQFFAESVAITALAFVLAAGLAALSLPVFAQLVDRPLTLADALTPGFTAVAAGLLVVVSLAAGLYPALVLATRKPAELFQKRPGVAQTGMLRTAVVAVQFGLTATVMITAVAATAQLRHMRSLDLGFDPRDILVIAVPPELRDAGADLAFRSALARSASVEYATARSLSPRADYGMFTVVTDSGGNAPSEPVLGAFVSDAHFFDVYDVAPVAGRVFSEERGVDAIRFPNPDQPVVQSSIILSESAVEAYSFASADAAVGETLVWPIPTGRIAFTVIGVVPDIHVRLGRQRVLPTSYAMNDPNAAVQLSAFAEVAARVREGAAAAALDDARRIWAEHFPDAPMEYEFLEDRIATANADDTRLSRMLGFFASLSLMVACLGLFALASFVAAQRTHEIAVRKVLGASAGRVTRVLMWDFAKPVLLANLIAWPLAYLVLRPWLDRFAYRIDLSPVFFLGVSAIAFAVAMATVGARSLRSASVRPALVLRND